MRDEIIIVFMVDIKCRYVYENLSSFTLSFFMILFINFDDISNIETIHIVFHSMMIIALLKETVIKCCLFVLFFVCLFFVCLLLLLLFFFCFFFFFLFFVCLFVFFFLFFVFLFCLFFCLYVFSPFIVKSVTYMYYFIMFLIKLIQERKRERERTRACECHREAQCTYKRTRNPTLRFPTHVIYRKPTVDTVKQLLILITSLSRIQYMTTIDPKDQKII